MTSNRGAETIEAARRYAAEQRNASHDPYGERFQKQLRRWFLAGANLNNRPYVTTETNFEKPLQRAYLAGREWINSHD